MRVDPRRTAIAVLAVCFLLNMLGRGSGETYAVFLLPLEREFGWTRSQLTGVYSVYLLMGGFMAPLAGLIFDRFGPRTVYTAGLACLGGAFLLASMLESLWQFYLFIGVLIGVGVGLTGMIPASALLTRWYRARLSSALGIAFAASGMGALTFVPAAQLLLGSFEWRLTYRIMGLALLFAAPLAALLAPWKTFIAGHPELQVQRKTEARAGEGWTVRAAMGTRTYWGLAAVFFFTATAMFTNLVQVVVYFIDMGFSPLTAASAYGLTGMLSVLSVGGSGLLADRFGYRQVVTASFVGTGSGVLILLAISYHPGTFLLGAFVVVYGLCMGVRGPIISSIATRRFAGARVATIYGTIYALNALGAAFGSLIGGVLHDLTGGYRAAFLFSLAAVCVAAAPFWVVRELRDYR